MPKLEPPDTFALSAALGWMELKNLPEAEAELAQVSAEHQAHPDVLEVRWLLCAEKRDWAAALDVARQVMAVAPERVTGWLHQAYAARRAPGGSLAAAWEVLLPAAEKFPSVSIIPFNLACYACQMGELDQAREWLRRAFDAGPKVEIRGMAMQDEDLRPLWDEIRKM